MGKKINNFKYNFFSFKSEVGNLAYFCQLAFLLATVLRLSCNSDFTSAKRKALVVAAI